MCTQIRVCWNQFVIITRKNWNFLTLKEKITVFWMMQKVILNEMWCFVTRTYAQNLFWCLCARRVLAIGRVCDSERFSLLIMFNFSKCITNWRTCQSISVRDKKCVCVFIKLFLCPNLEKLWNERVMVY